MRRGRRRRQAPGEPGDGEVEGAPEEVHRAGLASVAATEPGQHAVGADQGGPERVDGLVVVAGVLRVLGEGDRVVSPTELT